MSKTEIRLALNSKFVCTGALLKFCITVFISFYILINTAEGKQLNSELGFVFSPDLGYRFLSNSGTTAMSRNLAKTRNNSEVPAFGFSTGYLFSKSLPRRQNLETGILYSNNGYAMNDLHIIGASYQTIGKADVKIRHKWLSIPLRYIFHPVRESNFIMGCGFSYQYLMEQKTIIKLNYSDGRKETRRVYTSTGNNLNFLLSGGYSRQIDDTWRFSVELEYRQGLFNVYSDQSPGTYLWNVGLKGGLYYSLGQ